MNKKVTGIIFAALTAVLISGTVLMPTVTTVFAAEQMSDQEQPTPPSEDAPKDDDNGHSGHDMHDMKNM
jgi:hypothetical protein